MLKIRLKRIIRDVFFKSFAISVKIADVKNSPQKNNIGPTAQNGLKNIVHPK
jgi:hypothetical protein